MTRATKFGVSLDRALLEQLDQIAKERNYHSRSQAIADFVRRAVAKKQYRSGAQCAGVISLVFPPSEKQTLEAAEKMLSKNSALVLSWQNFHLADGLLFSVIAVKGKPSLLEKLADGLRGIKGLRYGSFSITGPAA